MNQATLPKKTTDHEPAASALPLTKDADQPISHLVLDMDGCFVDFVGGVCRLFDRPVPADWPAGEYNMARALGVDENELWRRICNSGYSFWYDLAGLPWKDELVSLVRAPGVPVTIASHPLRDDPLSWWAKRSWIRTRMPHGFGIDLSDDKSRLARPGWLLIDDCDANIDAWRAAGGTAITLPQPWNRRHARAGSSMTRMTHVRDELDKLTWVE